MRGVGATSSIPDNDPTTARNDTRTEPWWDGAGNDRSGAPVGCGRNDTRTEPRMDGAVVGGVATATPVVDEWAAVELVTLWRGGSLGDFVTTLPAIDALRAAGRRVLLVGNRTVAASLAPERFTAIAALDEPRWAGLFDDAVALPAGHGAAIALLRDGSTEPGSSTERVRHGSTEPGSATERMRHGSTEPGSATARTRDGRAGAVSARAPPRAGAIAARLARAGWDPVAVAPPHPSPDSRDTVAEHLYRAVAATLPHAVPFDRDRRRLAIGHDARERARARLAACGLSDRYVVIHPGSGSRRKNWPADRFAILARALAAARQPVVLVGGEADRAVLADVAVDCTAPVLTDLDLAALAAVLANAALYVGNDSGVTHVAGAVGAPTLAIFGPTRARRWRPHGPTVVAIEPVERCAICRSAEQRPVECVCLASIGVADVESVALELLDGSYQ